MSAPTTLALRPAIELCYAIAREGVEVEPQIDPPEAMRSFLYVVNLPERGFDVAIEAVEKDEVFRLRVAEHADEGHIGTEGYLWLVRPEGWQEKLTPELSEGQFEHGLNGLLPVEVDLDVYDEGENKEMASVSHDQGSEQDGVDRNAKDSTNGVEEVVSSNGETIDNELSSLRGLVDRLSSERQSVMNTHERSDSEAESARHQPSMFEADLYTLQHDLDTARAELEVARHERETAQRQHSLALTRQVELEKQLTRLRDQRARLEEEHAGIDAIVVDLKEGLARNEALVANLELERDQLGQQAQTLASENELLSQDVAHSVEDRNSLMKAHEAEYQALESQYQQLAAERDEHNLRRHELEQAVADREAQLAHAEGMLTEANSLSEALADEKIDLASRLADTESMLETVRAQLSAVKGDYDDTYRELQILIDQRQQLGVEVENLQSSLTEALSDLSVVREANDSDREQLRATRMERDDLRVRVGALEEEKQGLESQLTSISSERSTLSAKSEQLKADLAKKTESYRELSADSDRQTRDLAKLKAAKEQVSGERDEMQKDLGQAKGQIQDLEGELTGAQRQVEQLTNENEAIQAQLVESDRLRAEAADKQGNALSELAQQLSRVEGERNRLERELDNSKEVLIEAFSTFEAVNAEAASHVREQVDVSSSILSEARKRVQTASGITEPEELSSFASASAVSSDSTDDVWNFAGDDAEADDDSAAASAVSEGSKLSVVRTDDHDDEPSTYPDHDYSVAETPNANDNVLRPFGVPEQYDSDYREPTNRFEQPVDAYEPMAGYTGDIDPASDELDQLSNELSQVMQGASISGDQLRPYNDGDDLDAVGELISRTVTDFDPSEIAEYEAELANTGEWSNGNGQGFDNGFSGTGSHSVIGAMNNGGHHGGGRRRIDVPLGIEDEVEVARFVVNSPDVVLLIDGDSVAKMGWPSLPVSQQRDALVSYLGDLAAETGASPDVVFDGRVGEDESLPVGRNLRIRLSTPPTEPAAALNELVDAYPEQWPIAVVTDDAGLAHAAADRGATVLNNGQLLDLFIAQ